MKSSHYILFVLGLVSVNILAVRWHLQWDITQDKVYSLSDGSRRLAQNLPRPVSIKFFISRSRKQLPAVIKNYAERIEEILEKFVEASNGKITLEVFDPVPDSEHEEWARRFGIGPAQLPDGEPAYFGAAFIHGNKEVTIPFFDFTREKFLEYELSESLFRVASTSLPVVGIMSPLQVMGSDLPVRLPNVPYTEPWAFVQDLQKLFVVKRVATTVNTIDPSIRVLVVIHPKRLPDQTLYAIDQFVMRGGRLMVAFDPLSRLDLGKYDARISKSIPEPGSELKKLFDAWGIQAGDAVIGDLRNPTRMMIQGRQVSLPMFISVKRENMSQQSAVTNQLNEVVIAEGGALEPKPGHPLQFEPLLVSSQDSGIFPDPFLAGYVGQAELDRQVRVDGKRRVLAAFVKGKFKSALPKGLGNQDPKDRSLAGTLTETKEETPMVIVGDTDFLRNEHAITRTQTGQIRPINDNLRFAVSSIEFLAGNDDLIGLRSRGQITRPFTRLQGLENQAQLKWRAEDARLHKRLEDLNAKLNDLQAAKDNDNRFTLSPRQAEEIATFRREEASLKKLRKDVRRNLREDIDKLGKRLTVTNLATVPLFVGLFGFQFFVRRTRRMRRGQRHGS